MRKRAAGVLRLASAQPGSPSESTATHASRTVVRAGLGYARCFIAHALRVLRVDQKKQVTDG